MESRARLLYIGSSVVDGSRLNDGREPTSPPSDSDEVDEARISAVEEDGRRWTTGGPEEATDSKVGMVGSSAPPRKKAPEVVPWRFLGRFKLKFVFLAKTARS